MTDLEALHRAILEDPVDDTLRLAFADALDETDNGANFHAKRAEFIRLQIRGEGRLYCVGLNRATEWFCGNLFVEDGLTVGPDGPIAKVHANKCLLHYISAVRFNVSRGFPFEAVTVQSVFSRCADDIFLSHPIQMVTIVDRDLRNPRQLSIQEINEHRNRVGLPPTTPSRFASCISSE